jgi:integrase
MNSYADALIISTKTHKPFTVHGLKHWVERYRRLSGVHFHVHQARHTFACALARQKANTSTIMKVLGHSTIRMTETYLRSIVPEDSREYINKLSF